MGHLSQLMDYESGYIEDLKGYIYNAQQELDFLRNTLDEIENERKLEYKSEKEKTNHLKYPLNQFRLIRRFDHDWPDVNKVIGRIKNLQVRIKCNASQKDIKLTIGMHQAGVSFNDKKINETC